MDSNNSTGFTASMYSSGTTDLSNTASSATKLHTLGTANTSCSSYSGGVAKNSFPANCWGYAVGASNDITITTDDSNYYPMVSTSATPITIMTGTNSSGGTIHGARNIYFGAKSDLTQASGTYAGTVVISVVSGAISNPDNPATPTDPVTPSTDDPSDQTPTYTGAESTVGGGSNGTTVYTRNSSTSTTATTTTQISDGDNTSLYPSSNVNPLGVTETTSAKVAENVADGGSPLAIGLAVSAAVAAGAGGVFFALAKRKKDDDDEEEEA